MELVFLNLVSNAIRYSDPLKPASFVEMLCVDGASDGKMVLCVRDNGIGIAESDQESVFERFFRAHAHRDTDLGVTGSGLGLAIVGTVSQPWAARSAASRPSAKEAHFSSSFDDEMRLLPPNGRRRT